MQQYSEHAPLPDWSAVPSNSAEDCHLLSQRVAYFGAVMFWLSVGFFVFNAFITGLGSGDWLAFSKQPGEALHAAASLVFGITWLVCRKGARTSGQLNLLDCGSLVVSLSIFAWKGVIESGGFQQATVTAMTSLATIVTHAIIVPATARRAFWVSLVASAPAVVAARFICVRLAAEAGQGNPWMVVLGTAYIGLWSALTVAVATLAARVIYGLRQRARAAREIGQYTLEARIGAGGMGVVYLARHSLLRRPTAIKLLLHDRAGERGLRRFEREAQLTSSLTHPNTVAVYDFGRTPDGLFYYVMEYLDGITLEDLVQHGGPLPPARVVHLLEQLCGALVEAHAIGLVHRDVKPANLMLCVRGGVSDHLKVLDFGLVKELADAVEVSADAPALVGTPLYMAPEAILDPARVSAAADLYSVGAVAYYLLVGETVFTGATTMEVCMRHVHDEPARASSRAEQVIPPEVDELVLACLSKHPAARPASAAALVATLRGLRQRLHWGSEDADTWWKHSAGELMASARATRLGGQHEPGPQTVAIDWAARHAPTVVA